MSLPSNILTNMNMLVLEKQPTGNYIPLHALPDWFSEIVNENNYLNHRHLINIITTFPFLEYFIEEAIEAKQQQKMSSGLWTEINNNNQDVQLEAHALYDQERFFVIIENKSPDFAAHHLVYQKARELALMNEKLIQEVNTYQRRLQSDIEQKILAKGNKKALLTLIETSQAAVMICKVDGHVEVHNKALRVLYNSQQDTFFKHSTLLDQWLMEAKSDYPEIKNVLKAGSSWEGEFRSSNKNKKKWLRLSITPVFNQRKVLTHHICIANDIDHVKKAEIQIDKDTSVDFVTQLPNRHQFWLENEKVLQQAGIEKNKLALLCLDLDFFKQINNEYGYSTGDSLLKMTASRIKNNVKKEDYVAHLGGDEFAVLLKKQHSLDEIKKIAQRISTNINEPIYVDDKKIQISCSIGASVYPKDGTEIKTLMKSADLAMYYAKELGRDQLQFYNEKFKGLRFKGEREKELKNAFSDNQFYLEYQPQVVLKGAHLFHLEALIRWQHPDMGLISPEDFIPLAESSGLIIPLGAWVLETACIQAKKLMDAGIETIIAVNVSPNQLRDPGFFQMVKDVLQKSELPPDNLELEITESTFVENIDDVVKLLDALRALGISISLDDFGSGFSSFNHLKKLPIDVLKIDRSFVIELETSKESRVIAATIVQLAKALSITVIAEGVETLGQLEFMQKHECEIVQGFFFYKPQIGSELIRVYHELIAKAKPK